MLQGASHRRAELGAELGYAAPKRRSHRPGRVRIAQKLPEQQDAGLNRPAGTVPRDAAFAEGLIRPSGASEGLCEGNPTGTVWSFLTPV